jgi:transcriptional regulator with XRE-family HTH domain
MGKGDQVGLRLRHARRLRGKSQVELAKQAGVTQASVSDLERGKSKSFRGTTLVAIAQTLQVNPEWLAKGIGRMEDGNMPPLPVDAERVARDWLKLAPEVRAKIADMIREMVKQSQAETKAVADEKVEAAYGRPRSKQ